MFLFKRNGVYYFQYFDEYAGKVKRKSTGQRIKQEALKYLMKFKPEDKKPPKVELISLQKFKDEYLRFASRNFSVRHTQNIAIAFEKLCSYIGKDKPLVRLSDRKLEEFLTDYYQKTKYGASLLYRALHAAFNKAIKWRYLETNPLRNFQLPRIPKNYPLFVTEDDFDKILTNTHKKDLEDIFVFAFDTGCRLSEITHMRWKSIDLIQNVIRVTNSETFTTKSKKERIIPMSDRLRKMLLKRLPYSITMSNSDELVFNKMKGVPYLSNAKEVAQILLKDFYFPKDNIKVLTDKHATKKQIMKSYLEFVENSSLNDRIIFFLLVMVIPL